MTTLANPTGPTSKRVVFVHPSGLHQIIGLAPDDNLPVVLDGPIPVGDRVIPFASLVRVTRGAAYYKEPLTCSARTFTKDPRQV